MPKTNRDRRVRAGPGDGDGATGAAFTNRTLVEWWICNGGANQQWQAVNGQLVNPATGKCLDDPASITTNGTQLQIWSCSGAANQQRHLP